MSLLADEEERLEPIRVEEHENAEHKKFYDCLLQGTIAEVKEWNKDEMYNTFFKTGLAPIHVVAMSGRDDEMETLMTILLKGGADVNAKTKSDHNTVLHLLIKHNHISVAFPGVVAALDFYPDVHWRNRHLRTAYDIAVAREYFDIASSVDGTMMPADARALYEKSVGVIYGKRLMAAILGNDEDDALLSVRKGANCNILNDHGCAAIHYVFTVYEPPPMPLVTAMHQVNADLNITDSEGDTALNLCIKSRPMRLSGQMNNIVAALIRWGALSTYKDLDGKDALALATDRNYNDIVRLLKKDRAQHILNMEEMAEMELLHAGLKDHDEDENEDNASSVSLAFEEEKEEGDKDDDLDNNNIPLKEEPEVSKPPFVRSQTPFRNNEPEVIESVAIRPSQPQSPNEEPEIIESVDVGSSLSQNAYKGPGLEESVRTVSSRSIFDNQEPEVMTESVKAEPEVMTESVKAVTMSELLPIEEPHAPPVGDILENSGAVTPTTPVTRPVEVKEPEVEEEPEVTYHPPPAPPPEESLNESDLEELAEGDDELMALLNDPNADVNRPNEVGLFPIHLAVMNTDANKRKTLIKLLMDKNADINIKALEGGNTPLHIAAWRKQLVSVKQILSYKPEYKTEDSDGKTARDIAEENGFTKIVELIDKYAKIAEKWNEPEKKSKSCIIL